MYYTYILKGVSFDKYYVGMSQDCTKRLIEHNAGKTTSTKAFVPWEIIYTEQFETREEARAREIYFKTSAGRRWRQKNLK
jgi:putative endonuclease